MAFQDALTFSLGIYNNESSQNKKEEDIKIMRFFPDGIPSERDYGELIGSDDFRAMEQFSDSFLSDNKTILRDYMNKWVADPLHQWSRQWEYPFVHGRVQQMIRHEPRPSILDAGSGLTFFPYYLNARSDAASIHCCDHDKTLTKAFDHINAGRDNIVEFSAVDLRDLPYDDESFHMVYCISVLEHTDDYEKIIEGFHRILRPGGTLVVTLDIYLDGTREIDADKGTALLTSLGNLFDKDSNLSLDLHSHISISGILTTLTAKDIDASLLPWKLPSFLYRIKSFIATGRFGSWPPPLTVFCLCSTKRSVH